MKPMTRLVALSLLATLGGISVVGCPSGKLDDETTCGEGVVGDPNKAPSIEIKEMDHQSVWIAGTVNNVDASRHRVIVYAQTDIYYVQPLISNPYTIICDNGTWGTWANPADRSVALVAEDEFIPENQMFAHPSTQEGVLAWDEAIPPDSNLRTVNWSGFTWDTKRYSPYGPGPNEWSDDPQSVWVDTEGLHLTIREVDGAWKCTEVWINRSLGYGVYEFRVTSRLDNFAPEVVLGMFVYASDEEEIDIEMGRLEKVGNENAQFVVQPYYHLNNRLNFVMDNSPTSTHRFEWREDKIVFTSWRHTYAYPPEPSDIIAEWTYEGPDIPVPGKETPRVNLWLYQGQPPSDGQSVEVVLYSFIFTP